MDRSPCICRASFRAAELHKQHLSSQLSCITDSLPPLGGSSAHGDEANVHWFCIGLRHKDHCIYILDPLDRYLPVQVFGPESGGQPDSRRKAYYLSIYMHACCAAGGSHSRQKQCDINTIVATYSTC